MHYGVGGCGPLKDYALTATDKAAAHQVYRSPARCEVWLGSTQLGQTIPASSSCESRSTF
jgi:hypothetical protein